MVAYNKFQDWVLYFGKEADCNADTINAYLSNAAPSASLDAVKADLAEISTGNGYTGPQDSTNTYTESGGTATLACTDITINATGSVGPFQYVVHYDDTIASPVVDPLICWHDYGSGLTLANGESFTIDYGASLFTIT